jgi:integrase/recombinase XerD
MTDEWAQLWISNFTAYMTVECGASEHTKAAYESDLAQFLEYVGKPMKAVKGDDIRAFIINRIDAGVCPRSVRRKVSAIKSFYGFVFAERGMRVDPTKTVRAPRAFKPVVRPITSEEVEHLLATIGTERALDIRNKAIIYAVYGSGFRASEVIRLTLNDLNFTDSVAKVRLGKGQKDRYVPLNDKERAALQLYLEQARPKLANEDSKKFVFLGRNGTPFTRQRLWQILTTLSIPVLGRAVSPHKYRHAFVSDLINADAEIRIVQSMVGHKSVLTTMGYMHDDIHRIRRLYLKAHPRGTQL